MNRLSLLSAGLLALTAAQAPAQLLYSRALGYPGQNRMSVHLALRQAQAGALVTIGVSPTVRVLVTAPVTMLVDAKGYGSAVLNLQGIMPNSAPQQLTVTLAHPSFPGGALTRDYVVKSSGNNLGSAWPEVAMSLGAFCNPSANAQAHLEVDRASDLDGDGVYGDNNVELSAGGRDPLDFANEQSMDVNTQGTTGCIGAQPPGLFRPGGSARTVAFMADNRVVTGTCAFTTKMNFLEDIAWAQSFNGAPAILGTASGLDNVLICRDSDGDGSLTDPEIKVFFDPVALINNENYSPDSIAPDPTAGNRAYWSSDKSGTTGSKVNMGIWRLVDANGDDAIGAGEFNAVWTGSTAAVVVEGQTIDASEFECLHVDNVGGVLVNSSLDGTIFRWQDGNGNGVAETGEVVNWFTYNFNSLLTRNADVVAGLLPQFMTAPFSLNTIESVANVGIPPREVFFVGATNGSGTGAGFIFRCEDKNGNGSVNDAGDVTAFSDPAALPPVNAPTSTFGMDCAAVDENGNGILEDTEVFVYGAHGNGPLPSCGFPFADLQTWRFRDLDGDGDATGANEAGRVMINPTGAFCRGLELLPNPLNGGFQHTFYARSALVTIQNAGCQTTAGNVVELDFLAEKLEEGTQGTPFGDNQRFTLVTRGNPNIGLPNCGMALAGLSGPPVPFLGCTLGLVPPLFVDLFPAQVPDPAGEVRWALPIPSTVRGTVYLQPYAVEATRIILGEVGEMRVN